MIAAGREQTFPVSKIDDDAVAHTVQCMDVGMMLVVDLNRPAVESHLGS